MQVIQFIRSSAVFLQLQIKSEDYRSAAYMTWELAHLLVSVILMGYKALKVFRRQNYWVNNGDA